MMDKSLDLFITLDEISEFFRSLKQYRCPVCGNETFTIQSRDQRPVVRETAEFSFIPDGNGGIQVKPEEKALPGYFVQAVCNNCGHVNAHNYLVLYDKIVKMRREKTK